MPDTLSPDTVQLALAIKPGQTAHQLAGQLGLRVTYGNRRQPDANPVRACLELLERAGHVRHEDVPGGRGARGFRRVWYLTDARDRQVTLGRWTNARKGAA